VLNKELHCGTTTVMDISCCRVLHRLKQYNYSLQEAFEKCWAHMPLRAAARPFTRCRHCCTRASMSTTTTTTMTTTTMRDRGDRYGPIEWAQQYKSTKFFKIMDYPFAMHYSYHLYYNKCDLVHEIFIIIRPITCCTVATAEY